MEEEASWLAFASAKLWVEGLFIQIFKNSSRED
jgi:hypothetical protein